MGSLLRKLLLCAAVVPLLLAATADTSDAAQRGRRGARRGFNSSHNRYWNGYWNWYGRSYRPYWNRRAFRRNNNFYGGSNVYYRNTPWGSVGGVRVGPFRFRYRDWD
jgi:hypothetical protein